MIQKWMRCLPIYSYPKAEHPALWGDVLPGTRGFQTCCVNWRLPGHTASHSSKLDAVETEAGGSGALGPLWLCNELETNLGCVWACLKQTNKTRRKRGFHGGMGNLERDLGGSFRNSAMREKIISITEETSQKGCVLKNNKYKRSSRSKKQLRWFHNKVIIEVSR